MRDVGHTKNTKQDQKNKIASDVFFDGRSLKFVAVIHGLLTAGTANLELQIKLIQAWYGCVLHATFLGSQSKGKIQRKIMYRSAWDILGCNM